MASKQGKSGGGKKRFNPEKLYNDFPSGEDIGFGRDDGYGELRQINKREWFTTEAQSDPVIKAFIEAGEGDEKVTFSYLQLKSSTSESEWFVHKPHLAFSDSDKTGIGGTVPGFVPGQRIGTYVINHHRTLALRPVRTMVVSDGTEVGQIVHKGDNGS
jgi:hypothetical protein